jgi:hypothetical protein
MVVLQRNKRNAGVKVKEDLTVKNTTFVVCPIVRNRYKINPLRLTSAKKRVVLNMCNGLLLNDLLRVVIAFIELAPRLTHQNYMICL